MVAANVRHVKEREALLTRRRRALNGSSGSTDAERAVNDLTDESQSLFTSQNLVGELLSSGQAQLSSLIEQRQKMKGVKGMVIKMGSKLGLSNSTMRMIERRDATDAYLVFGGMFVTCIVLYLVWFR